jgi:hypothetical protein
VRAQYNSFHDLYNEGIKTDVHPAGLEVFLYYWMQIAGSSPFAVRLPFALCGIFSVLLIYLIAKRWFNSFSALVTSAAMATLEFPLLYSQVARMYSIGLFFCLLNIWCWNKILFPEGEIKNRKKLWIYIVYILSASSAMYLHYFSFLFIGIVGFTGFIFLERKIILAYFLSWILILVLYLPAISLFIEQIKMGGLEDWLAEPGSNTIMRYLFYCFNDSEILTSVIFAVSVLSIVLLGRNVKFNKFHLIALLWFLIPYGTAYYYSIYRQPVLQYSGLLFSFPMLLILLFSFLPDKKVTAVTMSLVILFLSAIGTSTVIENKFYNTPHFGVFKELAENTLKWDQKYGEKNITKIFTFSNSKYIDYYFDRMGKPKKADLNLIKERSSLTQVEQLLDSCKTPYLLYAWSNSRHSYETMELITGRFPQVLEADTFFNSEIILFKRNAALKEEAAFQMSGSFQEPVALAEKQKEFKVILYQDINELNLSDENMATAEVQINFPDSLKDVELVVTFESYEENIGWSGVPVKYFYSTPGQWGKAILSAPIPDERNCLMKVFIWNPKKRSFTIGDYKIKIKKKNPLYKIV